MAKIFVSYRRSDAEMEAGRITDWLDRHFGDDDVFMDIDAIEPGESFRSRIGATVASVDALVAVIGRSWLGATDEQGRRRLDNPHDVLRVEIASALERGILVVPICVQGVSMPRAEELPADLQPLAERNALSLSSTNWRPGMERLIAALERVIGPGRPVATTGGTGPLPTVVALVGAALLVAGLFFTTRTTPHETLLHPRFGGSANFHNSSALWRIAGLVSALPVFALAALTAIGTSWLRARRAFALGLLVATGAQGVAYYAGVLTARGLDRNGAFFAALLGGVLVLAAAWLARAPVPVAAGLDQRMRILAGLGAVAMLVGMTIDFNSGGTDHRYASSVFDAVHVERWDVVVVAIVALAVALTTLGQRRTLAAGLLAGCGFGIAFVWLRFVVIPLLQSREVATPAAGGYVGLLGACLVAYAGVAALRERAPVEAVAHVAPTS